MLRRKGSWEWFKKKKKSPAKEAILAIAQLKSTSAVNSGPDRVEFKSATPPENGEKEKKNTFK